MWSVLAPLLASALGGAIVAGCFGVYNNRVAKEHEHEKWLRDQKIEAYQTHIVTHDALMFAIARHYIGNLAEEEVARAIGEAQSGLHILAPPLVYEASNDMAQHLGTLAADTTSGRMEDRGDEVMERIDKYYKLRLVFAQAARKDLNIDAEDYVVSGSNLPDLPASLR